MTKDPPIEELLRMLLGHGAEIDRRRVSAAQSERGVLEPIADGLVVFSKTVRSYFEALEAAKEEFIPLLHEIAKRLESLPEREREGVLTLGKHGWFPSPELLWEWLFRFDEMVKNDQLAEAQDLVCAEIERSLNQCESRLCAQFPLRSHLIRPALQAHRGGQYSLSIPALLAQADGVTKELIGGQLYGRNSEGPRVASSIQTGTFSDLADALWIPLLTVLPHIANPAERLTENPEFNRHAILHGESVDFDTRINSARAISLLGYVAWMLGEVRPLKK